MTENPPKISVIMPVYNSEKYLREAIDSVLSQKFSDFEFIIVDDASTDKSLEIIESYSDPRIIILQNNMNLGLPGAINKGISLSRGTFIARMDADDISLPNRFKEQILFMENNPDIVMCGTFAQSIGNKKSVLMKHPTDPDEIKVNLLFKTSFIHPTIMMRREFMSLNNLKYDPEFLQAQDYELFTRISRVGKTANIPKVLLLYRKHEKQTSVEKNQKQNGYAKKIIKRELELLSIEPGQEDLDVAISLKGSLFLENKHFPPSLERLFIKIVNANNISKIYPDKVIKKVFGDMWLDTAVSYSSKGTNTWNTFWNGAPRKWIRFDIKNMYRISKIFLFNSYSWSRK